MKKVKTSYIAGSVGQPIKSGTLSHLQDAYKEAFQIMVQNLYGIANNSLTVYVLYGCVNSGLSSVSGVCNISAGAVYYNGEIYYLPATTFTIGTGLVAIIDQTQNSNNYFVAGNADPVTMTDNSTEYVHSKFRVTVVDGDTLTTGWIANYANFVYDLTEGTVLKTLVVGDITATGGAITGITSGACSYRRVGRVVHFDIKISAAVLTGTNTKLTINVNFLAPNGIVVSSYPSASSKTSTSYIGLFGSITGSGAPSIELTGGTSLAAGTYDIYVSGRIYC